MMSVDRNNLIDLLKQLKSGTNLIKIKTNGKKYPRRFFLDPHEHFISYQRFQRKVRQTRVYRISDIDEVRPNIPEDLSRRGKLQPNEITRSFTIIYNDHREQLHLIAPVGQIKEQWLEVLTHLIDRHSETRQGHVIHEENWILHYFQLADKNRSNTLNKRECQDLLAKSFNVVIPEKTFVRLFNQADRSREGVLNGDEFVQFFHLLTRRQDLYEIMKRHSKTNGHLSLDEIYFDHHDLLTFLQQEQNIKSINHRQEVRTWIEKYELNPEFRQRGRLSLEGFRNLLLSPEFDLQSQTASRQIYQDMTSPLCDYYINTSHNTYLFNSQVIGDSSPEAYNRALLSGGRAVELDCYDGDDGQPIVTHGFTLVKSCTFESIIRAIEPNLFKTSPYPVILNIENHCSPQQQIEMARILKTILADHLVTARPSSTDGSMLPSPEELKYKVLVRSKRTTPSNPLLTQILTDDAFFTRLDQKVQPELEELFIYLENVTYRDGDYANRTCLDSPYHSSSLVEKHFLKLTKETPLDLVQQTTWRILRTYPDGSRQDSSNQNPVLAWNFGIQMAALNFQTNDEMMALAHGKFLDNGGCGYVRKPDYLIRAREIPFNPNNALHYKVDQGQQLKITIISGQFLSRSKSKSSDIPDPYVNVSIHGLPCDQQQAKTNAVKNNGFNPQWQETFFFRVYFPQMALIYFSVYDSDPMNSDDRIAFFTVPCTMIQTGYRHIHLRAPNNDSTYSTLFVHVQINQESDSSEDDDIIRVRL